MIAAKSSSPPEVKKKGSSMYVLQDAEAGSSKRVMKAVKDEGMPTYKNPFVHGNLFLILNIEFPDSLSAAAIAGLRENLPPPLNVPMIKEDDPNVEVHKVTEMDPVLSFNSNKLNMTVGNEAYDEDEEGG